MMPVSRPARTMDLITTDQVLIVAVLVALIAAILATSLKARRRFRSRRPLPPYGSGNRTDPGQQLNAVMAARFEKQRLMNSGEYHLFRIVEAELARVGRGHHVFAQTCLGEVLRSPDADGYSAINSKRVDLLVIDAQGLPVLGIEYQGDGHYQGTAAARDAIKKEALRRAGVGYLEVFAGEDDARIATRVREALGNGIQWTARAG